MRRSRVDFPEPERPRRPTISPRLSESSTLSSTRSSPPLGRGNERRTACTSRRTSSAIVISPFASCQSVPPLGEPVERTPEQAVHNHHEKAHDHYSEHDPVEIARRRRVRNI